MTARRALVVCTTPRSGSRLLCDTLWRTGLAGHPDEYFAPAAAGREARRDPAGFLRGVVERATTPNGVLSIKVHWDHIATVLRVTAAASANHPAPDPSPFAALAEHVDCCWLVRRDTVRQAISLYLSHATGQWQASQTARVDPDTVPFDFQEIRQRHARIGAWNNAWSRFFSERGLSPISLCYEDDLEHDVGATVLRLLGVLGVAARPNLALDTASRRQANARTEEWVRRYHEAAATLPG